MRIAFVNAYYQRNHAGGGHVHMEQFVSNATAAGHEIWAYPNHGYTNAITIPTNRIDHIKAMRKMDVLYVRLESRFPEICTWTLPPRRWLYRFPLVVWEFNTIPDDASFRGESVQSINRVVQSLRHYGSGCDLAVCVAPAAAEYVQKNLGIERTLVVANGSDPSLFHPDVQPVIRMEPFRDFVNVVWVGSAGIRYHDFDMLRNAATILWDQGERDRIRFHVIGANLVGEMATMPPNVFYWGAEHYSKLPYWLAAMDIGLYITRGGTSVYGSPLKVFDYLASGLAVVSTEHPFVRDLFRELCQTELMVPSGSAGGLANVLKALASDPEWIHRQGQLGRQLIINRYNWRRAIQDTMSEIETLFQQQKKSSLKSY